jgi:hypothetical protein
MLGAPPFCTPMYGPPSIAMERRFMEQVAMTDAYNHVDINQTNLIDVFPPVHWW